MSHIKHKLNRWKAQIAWALLRSLIASKKEEIAWSIYDKLTGGGPDMPLSPNKDSDYWMGIAIHHAKDSKSWEDAYKRAVAELEIERKMLMEIAALLPSLDGNPTLAEVVARTKWLQEQQAERAARPQENQK